MKKFLLFVFLPAVIFSQQVTLNFYESENPDSILINGSGVISGPLPAYASPAPDLTDALTEIGITSIRNNDYYDDRLDMERLFNCLGDVSEDLPTYPNWQCDPSDSSNYHFEASDSLFNAIINGGFDILFRIGGEYNCGIRTHDYKGPRIYEENNFIEASKNVVRHYLYLNGSEGNFTYLNLWTEYPNLNFWDRSAPAFARFWRNLYIALKTEFPQLKIGGPGLLTPFDEFTDKKEIFNDAVTFFDTLYHSNVRPDWVGFHHVRNSVTQLNDDIVYFRKFLKGEPPFDYVSWSGSGFFDNIELVCDAYLFSQTERDSNGTVIYLTRAELDELFNRAKGAALQTAYWIVLKRNGVEKNYWYRAGDPLSFPGLPPSDPNQVFVTGLFWGDSSGVWKKTPYAIKLRNWLVKENYVKYLRIPEQYETGVNDSLWTLVARKDSNNFAVIIANIGLEPKSVIFRLNDKQISPAQYEIKFKVVSESSDGEQWRALTSNSLFVPKYGVLLVKFSKRPAGVSDENLPNKFELMQNYPNPFNPVTTIKYSIPTNAGVETQDFASLRIYNILGEEVATLVNQRQSPGNYSVQFDASNLPSGIYFYTLRAGDFVATKKMLLLK